MVYNFALALSLLPLTFMLFIRAVILLVPEPLGFFFFPSFFPLRLIKDLTKLGINIFQSPRQVGVFAELGFLWTATVCQHKRFQKPLSQLQKQYFKFPTIRILLL